MPELQQTYLYLCVSVCVYECECVDRSCQGGATGISNKQQIIHVSILWPKHGCQIFVPLSSFWVQEKNLERHAERWSGGSLFFHSFTHDDDNNDQSQFVHILNKAHSENLYEFLQDLCEQRDTQTIAQVHPLTFMTAEVQGTISTFWSDEYCTNTNDLPFSRANKMNALRQVVSLFRNSSPQAHISYLFLCACVFLCFNIVA